MSEWGQDGSRIKMLKETSEFVIYTPGSNAGTPVSILDSFKAPTDEILDDGDLFGDKISATTSSLLGLLGIDADPLKSKEHILLSNILQFYWAKKNDLDLPKIIQSVQTPPFSKIGVFDIESFYPEKERFSLAMQLNNILSAPGFQTWLTGDPLDIDKLLYNENGKPKTSIFYIAHLSDSERMFFSSLLLNQLIGWMRSQSGTTSLRALLYVDEIFGYIPPVANPATKKPFLTLLKQARAFGVGLVLATQNPVDLDYKSLSNAGTWFIGRLQTDRDRMRVLDGLEGATLEGGGKFDRAQIDRLLSNLDKRVFLLHNVNEPHPVIFNTRWAMSYLRGPLTRTQIKDLMNTEKPSAPSIIADTTSVSVDSINVSSLPKSIKPLFFKREIAETDIASTQFKPYLIAQADIRFYDRTKKIDLQKTAKFLVPITKEVISVKWNEGYEADFDENLLQKNSTLNLPFAELPAAAKNEKNFSTWENFFEDYLTNEYYLELYSSSELKETSKPNESVRDFKIRLSQITREQRDSEMEKLKDSYQRKIKTIESRIQRAQ
ncbi:MAG: ATP-binding protein, partial [Ignavibacteriae bacterium]|nr:ATP-binding protein [Ignavibacteriota bacterium]